MDDHFGTGGSCAFAYIAFIQSTGAVIAHGHQAIDALSEANRLGPDELFSILYAGDIGQKIWTQKIPFLKAVEMVSGDVRGAVLH